MPLDPGDPWCHPVTPPAYEAFSARRDPDGVRGGRYGRANLELVRHAALEPGMQVLDVGAGLGGTARAVLEELGPRGRVVCVEPSLPMRRRGRQGLVDPRVRWCAGLPEGETGFDRVTCGAALWQLRPLAGVVRGLAARLRPGGALVFTIPSLVLGEGDGEGGGGDPWFGEFLGELGERGGAVRSGTATPKMPDLPDPDGLESVLRAAGLEPDGWEFRYRLTRSEYAAWLELPPVNHGLLSEVPPEERASLVERALAAVESRDRAAGVDEPWRWERWRGWTAWKEPSAWKGPSAGTGP